MKNKVIERYSKSLFDTALEKNILTDLLGDIIELNKLLDSSVIVFFISPLYKLDHKKEVVEKLISFSDNSDILFDFIVLVIKNKRSWVLKNIFKRFISMVDEHNGILRGDIFSTDELSKEKINYFENKLSEFFSKKVIISPVIDNKIIAGYKIELNTYIIDITLKRYLSNLASFLNKELLHGKN